MKALWYLVYFELVLFVFTSGVSFYNLSIKGPLGNEYRSMQRFHTLVTLILIYLAIDHRRLAKGYIAAFSIVWTLDLIHALETTLYLSKSVSIAYHLDMASAWANVGSTTLILAWYTYIVCRNKDHLSDVHLWEERKQTSFRIL